LSPWYPQVAHLHTYDHPIRSTITLGRERGNTELSLECNLKKKENTCYPVSQGGPPNKVETALAQRILACR
jgi:hypothetical protein